MEKTLLFVDDTRERAAQIRLQDMVDNLNMIFSANITLQPGYLLSEVLLAAGVTAYQFPVLNTNIDNSVFPLSYGVNQNDIFMGISRELTVDNRSATTATDIYPQTYYNKQVFTAATTTTPGHIQFIWNSIWNFQVGSKTYIQNQFTRKDLRQPFTQQSSASNYPYYYGCNLINIDPWMLISGKATNYLNFKINASAAFAGEGAGGTKNVLSWYMQGFTLQNGAGFARFFSGDEDIQKYILAFQAVNQAQFAAVKAGKDPGQWNRLPYQDAYGNLI